MLTRPCLILGCVFLGSLIAALAPTSFVMAQQHTALPTFTGAAVYVVDVPDTFAPVRAEIERLEAASPQSYYVVVVRSSGAGEWATRTYVDDLYQAWQAQAAERALKLDADRSVLIVLAIDNRQLAVHPGRTLQDTLGLRAAVIDRELVAPKFVPFAKSGDFVAGLKTLIDEFDRYVSAKEVALANERAASEAQAAQLQHDATTTLAATDQLRADVQRELAEKQPVALDIHEFDQRLTDATTQLSAAQTQLPGDPAAALAAAQQAQNSLNRLRAELHARSSLAQQAAKQLGELETLVQKVETAIDEQGRANLAVGSLQAQLDQQAASLAAAKQSAQAPPDQAIAAAGQIEASLQSLLGQASKLVQKRLQTQERAEAVRKLHDTVVGELKDAEAAGLPAADMQALQSRFIASEKPFQMAERMENTDYASASSQFDAAGSDLKALSTDISRQLEQHRFNTQTVPIVAGLALAGSLALALAGRWLFHWRKRRAAVADLAKFKEQVVTLSDTLDALKERHKMLPFTDADYTEPMNGETLSLYNGAETAIGRYRERWLKLMDAWQTAQRLLESEGPFGTRSLRDAQQAIGAAGAPDELKSIAQDCAGPLDRLEQAHEEAARLSKLLASDREQVDKRLESLRTAQLATVPYQPMLDAATASADHSAQILRADPIGAQTALAAARDKIGQANQLGAAVWQQWQALQAVRSRRQATVDMAARRRAEGLLLVEEGGNPDALLTAAEEDARAALDDLNQARAEAAAKHIGEANQSVERANQAISAQIEARDACGAEIPARRAELERLRLAIGAAAASRTELERDFAPDCWREVDQNLPQAQALLAQCDRRGAEAVTAADVKVQHYAQAATLLREIKQLQHQAAGLLTAVGQRLVDLKAARDRCRSQLGALQNQARQVADFLRSNTADRPRSNQRYQAAQQLLDQASAQAGLPRADWLRLQSQLAEVGAGLDQAMQLAREDIHLAQQAMGEIADAQRAIQRAKSWYRLGFSADVSAAESQWIQAGHSLQARAYEEAITQANFASRTAAAAQQAAELQAQSRQLQMDERRRQQERATASATAMAASVGSIFNGSPSASQSTSTPSVGDSPRVSNDSSSSQTSFGSSSSQTSW